VYVFTEARIKEPDDGQCYESESENEIESQERVIEFRPLANASSRETIFSNPEGTCSCHAFRLLRKCPHMVYLKNENVIDLPEDKEIRDIVKLRPYVDTKLLETLRQEFIPQLRSKTSEAQLQEPMELQYLPADSQIDSNLRKSLEYLTTAVKICTSEERKAKIDAILTSAVEQCKKEVGCNELQPHAEYSDRKKRIRTLKEFLRR